MILIDDAMKIFDNRAVHTSKKTGKPRERLPVINEGCPLHAEIYYAPRSRLQGESERERKGSRNRTGSWAGKGRTVHFTGFKHSAPESREEKKEDAR